MKSQQTVGRRMRDEGGEKMKLSQEDILAMQQLWAYAFRLYPIMTLILLIGIVVAGLMYGMIRQGEDQETRYEGRWYAVDHRDR